MPGSTPATSQLDWLSSTTAMIVLSWSKATRDLLKSFSWGIGALRQLFASDDGAISFAACPIPSLRWREPDSNHRSRCCKRLCWALPIGTSEDQWNHLRSGPRSRGSTWGALPWPFRSRGDRWFESDSLQRGVRCPARDADRDLAVLLLPVYLDRLVRLDAAVPCQRKASRGYDHRELSLDLDVRRDLRLLPLRLALRPLWPPLRYTRLRPPSFDPPHRFGISR